MAINYTRKKDDFDNQNTVFFTNSDDMVLPGMSSNDARPMEMEQQERVEVPHDLGDSLPNTPAVEPSKVNGRFFTPKQLAIAIIVLTVLIIICILLG